MRIVDAFNRVGNEFAVSSDGIATALQGSASALASANNDMESSIALVAAANRVVQDESEVGAALRTISLRLRGTSISELEELGESTEGAVESVSKLQSKLLGLTGVDILNDDQSYKSTYEILLAISEVFATLDDQSKAATLELIAGKNRSNVASALLTNTKDLKAAYEAASTSSGSADKELDTYLSSIQGKIDQFNNATQAMWSNFLNADVIKFIVELGTGLVKIVDKFGLIETFLFSFLTFKSVFSKGSFDLVSMLGIHELDKGWVFGKQGATGWFAKKFINKKAETEEIEKTIDDITDSAQNRIQSNIKEMPDGQLSFAIDSSTSIQEETQEYQSLLSVMSQVQNVKLSMGDEQKVAVQIDEINAAASQGQVALTQYASTLGDGDMALKAYIASLDGGQASLAGFNQFIQQHNAKVKSSGIAAKAAAVGHSLLNAAISMGISLIVSAAISAITALINKHQELARAAKEAMSAYSDATNTLREHNNTIEDIKDDYTELADGVDSLGNNVSLTTEEYKRYNEMANKIADMFPQMVSGYTEEGNAILKLKGNVEALKDAYESEAKAARDALLVEADKIVGSNYNASGSLYDAYGGDGFWADLGKFAGESFSVGLWNATASSTELGALKKYMQDGGTIDGSGWSETDEVSHILQTLKDAGADLSYWEILTGDKNALDRIISENRAIVDAVLGDIDSSLTTAASANRSVMDAYLKNSDKYNGLDEKTKDVINNVVQNLDEEFLISFKNSTDMYAWILDDLLGGINNLSADNEAKFDVVFDLQTQFNSGDVSVDAYLTQLSEFETRLRELGVDEEIIKSISLLFDTEGLDAKKNVAKDFLLDTFDDNVGKLTKADLEIVDKYADEFKKDMVDVGYTWDAFIAKINEKKLIDAFSPQDFEKVSNGIDSIQNAYNSLSDAIEQYNNSGYLTLDSLQAILSLEPEYLALLQMENGQLSLNQAAAEAMIQAKLAEAEANAIQSAMTKLETLAKEDATNATNDNATAATNAITSLGNYSSALGNVAKDAIVAAGAVSALNNAVNGAKKAGVSKEDIDSVMGELDTYLSLIDTTRKKLSTNFVPIVSGGTGKDPEKETGATDDAFQREMDYWENRIAANQAKYEQLQNEIDLLETKGQKADSSFYEEQIKLEKEREILLEGQKKAAEAHLATLEEGSEEWWDVANTLNDIEGELDDVTASIVDLQDAIGEIDTYKFDEFNTRLDNLVSKLGTIRNLIAPDGEEDWFDDEGNWTEDGVAVLGTYIQELEMYKQGLAEAQESMLAFNDIGNGAEWSELTEEQKKDYADKFGIHSEQEYYDKQEELISQQYNFAESINDTEQSIVDMYESSIDAVEEYVDTLIDGYNDYIDSVKEALDAERDLYDFKKNVQKQAKDISELERRIASLSGSTNKADIAERRKLEAQLYESRESLNDTYYDHAKDAQNEALDAETKAYEETMAKMVEGMRESLEQATSDMTTFLDGVTTMVSLNAGIILDEYENTGLELDPALTTPWENAKSAVGDYSEDALELMNTWAQNGFLTTFSETVEGSLTSPWDAGAAAASGFKDDVDAAMGDVVEAIATNVKTASAELSDLYQQILDTEKRASSANITSGGGSYNVGASGAGVNTSKTVTAYLTTSRGALSATGTGETISKAQTAAKNAVIQKAYNLFSSDTDELIIEKFAAKWRNSVTFSETGSGLTGSSLTKGTSKNTNYAYAKGTTGVSKDQLAIVDELGPELILHADPTTGRLQYLTKGSGVMTADATSELMKLADIGVDGLMMPKFDSGINMMANYITKPEFNIDIEEFVHVDRVDQDTLPKLEAMMDKKINDFSRALNYSIKRFAR